MPPQVNGTSLGPKLVQESVNILDDNVYMEIVKCQSKEPSKLWLMPDFKISITKFEKNDGGVF